MVSLGTYWTAGLHRRVTIGLIAGGWLFVTSVRHWQPNSATRREREDVHRQKPPLLKLI
jgi:hypothetical protein